MNNEILATTPMPALAGSLDIFPGAPPDAAVGDQAELQQAISQYRLLIVPGFPSACSSSGPVSAPVSSAAQEHLKAEQGVDVVLLQVSGR